MGLKTPPHIGGSEPASGFRSGSEVRGRTLGLLVASLLVLNLAHSLKVLLVVRPQWLGRWAGPEPSQAAPPVAAQSRGAGQTADRALGGLPGELQGELAAPGSSRAPGAAQIGPTEGPGSQLGWGDTVQGAVPRGAVKGRCMTC